MLRKLPLLRDRPPYRFRPRGEGSPNNLSVPSAGTGRARVASIQSECRHTTAHSSRPAKKRRGAYHAPPSDCQSREAGVLQRKRHRGCGLSSDAVGRRSRGDPIGPVAHGERTFCRGPRPSRAEAIRADRILDAVDRLVLPESVGVGSLEGGWSATTPQRSAAIQARCFRGTRAPAREVARPSCRTRAPRRTARACPPGGRSADCGDRGGARHRDARPRVADRLPAGRAPPG